MTNNIFFDTDCICAFLWVNNQSLLEKLYSGRIVIPKAVYDEIDNPSIPHLKERIDSLIDRNVAIIESIEIVSPEAASIVLARSHDGILASNNLNDITEYVEEFSLKHKTTGDIMVEALEEGFITEEEGNIIWNNMLEKRRRLGAATFSDYLQNKK